LGVVTISTAIRRNPGTTQGERRGGMEMEMEERKGEEENMFFPRSHYRAPEDAPL